MTDQQTFTEAALELAGKSVEEVSRSGKVDRADEQVEKLFAERYRTSNSPIHRAVWDTDFPIDVFRPQDASSNFNLTPSMEASLNVIRKHLAEKTFYGPDHKIREEVLQELASVGYWGQLVKTEFGGQATSFTQFANFITAIAIQEATIAGLASVHGCIGAVDPIRTFGNQEQQNKYLPLLASGKKLSGFALTEPGAGSDLTALKTKAELEGDYYYITGEKLFITNATYGRIVGLVALVNNKPAVLIAELPEQNNETFELVSYGIYALTHAHNYGLKFNRFPIPKENLLVTPDGDGLTIAYHGLNYGRIALCANAAGVMRKMLATLVDWVKYRKTYGAEIGSRELIKKRIARLAGLIVGSDALSTWCSNLLDNGYRGELECIIAKIFGSEAQKEAAIELLMKTCGGRSFLEGHLLGDNIHDFLAPCIYEGEGEILGLAFFKSIVKEHGKAYFDDIGKTLAKLKVRKPNLLNPFHLWALKGPIFKYGIWVIKKVVSLFKPLPSSRSYGKQFEKYVKFAMKELRKLSLEISLTMSKYQLALADRQCRMAEFSKRIQKLVTIMVVAAHATNTSWGDDLAQDAAELLCEDIYNELQGTKNTDAYYKKANNLADKILAGEFKRIQNTPANEILRKY